MKISKFFWGGAPRGHSSPPHIPTLVGRGTPSPHTLPRGTRRSHTLFFYKLTTDPNPDFKVTPFDAENLRNGRIRDTDIVSMENLYGLTHALLNSVISNNTE